MKLTVSDDGQRWCSGGARFHFRGVKRYYETIDEAWRDAFLQFVRYGEVMTPYRCLPRITVVTELRTIPHPNPWAFRPWLSTAKPRPLKRRQCCAGFHMTRKTTGFILPQRVDRHDS